MLIPQQQPTSAVGRAVSRSSGSIARSSGAGDPIRLFNPHAIDHFAAIFRRDVNGIVHDRDVRTVLPRFEFTPRSFPLPPLRALSSQVTPATRRTRVDLPAVGHAPTITRDGSRSRRLPSHADALGAGSRITMLSLLARCVDDLRALQLSSSSKLPRRAANVTTPDFPSSTTLGRFKLL